MSGHRLRASQAEGLSAEFLEKNESPYWPGLGGPILLFLLALFLFARPLLLLGDGGTCRHFLNGLYILQHGAMPTTTYFSAVEPNSPWITHELLCDLLFGIPFAAFGLNWVVLSSALAIAFSTAWSYQIARLRGAGVFGGMVALIIAFEACTIHWSARPHIFTYLLFIACYYECFVAQRPLKLRLIVMSLIMILWGNLHGSFPLGILMIVFRAIGDFVERRSGNLHELLNLVEPQLWNVKQSLLLLLCSAIGVSLNVRGFAFINYVLGYLSSTKIHANSDEWRSIDFSLAAPAWSFIALATIVIFFWVYSKSKPKFGEFAYILFLFCTSLYAMRLIPYFAIAALPAMAVQMGELRTRESLQTVPLIGKLLSADNRASQSELGLLKQRWLMLGLIVVVSAIFLFAPPFKISDFDPTRMPVKAVNFIKDHGIKGLGFTKDNWGAYVYWRLGEPIFLDDKTDFYSQQLLDDYTAIFMTNPGWEKSLKKYHFKYVLIPRGLPLEFMLNHDQSWKRVYEDGTAVLFTSVNNNG